MTPLKVSIAATIVSLLLLVAVFELIRQRRLRERYALLWLATGLVLLVLSAWRGGLNTIASWAGVRSTPVAVLFAVGLMFVILVLLHYSTVISRLTDQNVVLAQRLALLEETVKLRRARERLGGRSPASCSRRERCRPRPAARLPAAGSASRGSTPTATW